ncbi:HdeD family acid-resistance protein [Halorientalis pallida]|uniref:HdeD family acid-resistance protein n=1 Tax=Halorientalis pallida TaxID=2479928 RepID=UPI003C6F3262
MSSDDQHDTDDRDSTAEAAETRNAAPRERSPGPTYSRSERSLARNRTSVMLGGVLLVLLGLAAILVPYVTGIAISILLGGFLVVGALVHTAAAFSARGWRGSIFAVVLGLLYGFAGITMLANPALGLVALTLVLAVYFLAEGVVQLVMGLRLRANENWGWLLASGIVSVLLSSLILLGFPASADWAVGLLFGVNLLTSGLALVLVGAAAPSAREVGTTRRVGESGTGSS